MGLRALEEGGEGWGQGSSRDRREGSPPPVLSRKIYDFLFCTQTKIAQRTFLHTSVLDILCELNEETGLLYLSQHSETGGVQLGLL